MKATSSAGTPISVLLFGAALGTIGSTLLHTTKGKQLVHDAVGVFDDLVALLEHTLGDDVEFEESLAGVNIFNEHVLDKLDRVRAFDVTKNESNVISVKLNDKKDVNNESSVKAVNSAFLYHKPIVASQSVRVKQVDDEVALLNRLGRAFR